MSEVMDRVKCSPGSWRWGADHLIRDFLSEESIIERTGNCIEYFEVPHV